jgi:pteridine reductase
MRVAVHYHASKKGAADTARQVEALGGKATLHQADLSDAAACRTLIRDVLDSGELDLLIPSAANFHRVLLGDVQSGDFESAMSLNAEAPMHLALSAADSLRRRRGAIVFITDAALERPHRDYLPYLMSKAAVRQLMETLAVELAPEVRVNAVAPGTVLPPADLDEGQIAELVSHIPLGRVGRAEDVAEAVVHLATCELVTGHELVVDGGHRLGG